MERDYLSSLLNLFRKRINKIFVGLLVIFIAACDFENPEDFEAPVWFIDIKLPLVSKRFPMGDLVDTTNFIFPTDDSAGFQILFTGLVDPPVSTEEMELGVRFSNGMMQQVISTEPIGGINGSSVDIDIPGLPIELIIPPISPAFPETTLAGGNQILFSLPIESPKVMWGSDYNLFFVGPLNFVLDSVFSVLNGQFPMSLGLSSLTAAITEPQITIDSLLISGTEETSYLRSSFKNNGYPTKLRDCSAYFISIDSIVPWSSNRDTIAPHFRSEVGSIFNDEDGMFYMGTFDTTTNLSVGGLTDSVQIFSYFQLDSVPPDSFVTLYPTNNDSMFIGYTFDFGFNGIDSAVVSIESYNIDLSDQLDAMQSQLCFSSSLPEMDGISFDITRAEMEPTGYVPVPTIGGNDIVEMVNKFKIDSLYSSFPWDINFYLHVPNMVNSDGVSQILIDELLQNDPFSVTVDLGGDFLQPVGDDTTIGCIYLGLQVGIPEQEMTIPLDGSPLGAFGMTIQFGSLFFHELKAYVNMDLTANRMEITGFPPEFTGIGFPELEFEFELFNEIDFPLTVDIEMMGIKPSEDTVWSKLNAKIGTPSYINSISLEPIDEDIVKTNIVWSDVGTIISFYAPTDDSQAVEVTLIPPKEGEISIIDFFGSMPMVAHADIKTRIDGTAGIRGQPSQIWGSFKIKMPFAVTMNAPPFIPPTGISKLPEFSPNNRNKIRHSLLESEFATNIENSLPLGGEFAILLSDQPFFPKDITPEALNDVILIDAMIENGISWDRPVPYQNSTDSLYIVDDCDELNPRLNTNPDLGMKEINIFDVMEDTSQCVDGMKYLVKHSTLDPEVDRVISYVDTLFRILLPSPLEYYSDTSTVGHPGQVLVPGVTGYSSMLDANRIFLLTDYGDRYTVPRFSFNQTGDQTVFFSKYDAIDIKSSITFRVASSGVFGATENDIVILNPNGGENWEKGSVETIRWKTYGEIKFVDVYYFVDDATENFPDNLDVEITDPFIPSDISWFSITTSLDNNDNDSYEWTVNIDSALYQYSDSVRIIIKESGGEVFDVSGWYFSVSEDGLLGRTSKGSTVINRGKLKRPRKSR